MFDDQPWGSSSSLNNGWNKDEPLSTLENVWGGSSSTSPPLMSASLNVSNNNTHHSILDMEHSIMQDSRPILNILGNDDNDNNGLYNNTSTSYQNSDNKQSTETTNNGSDSKNNDQESIDIPDIADWAENIRKDYHPLGRDNVVIEQISEREGMLFKHTNYRLTYASITGSQETTIVVRRYSDFVWLQEILIRRYPFRMIPELPPKKIGSQNNDEVFLIKRKKGLSGFINLILKHPILKTDDIVHTFLTLANDITTWRKNTSIPTIEEFQDKVISQSFIHMWKKEFAIQWNEADASIEKMVDIWSKIGALVERQEKRLRQIQNETHSFATLLDELIDYTPKLYNNEQNKGSILDINNHISIVKQNLLENSKIVEEGAENFAINVLPKFQVFIDTLYSLRKLFERYRIMAGNNIAQLHKHIESNKIKMDQEKGKPDTSSAEYDKLHLAIKRDRKEIYLQTNRAWLIRECVLQEFSLFQETQYLISEAFKNWVRIRSNTSGLDLNLWEKLVDNLADMPSRP
ncbi:hypothetical protein TBLA_0E03100 [Henningerozyma blattae CBS 6284]|uniref:Sorting nexin MVP1 n=1 Tax=Henningerozyma blattae (strain ATCC 34711 / CBS 6284 / DSM 70876 / NBRC 10599 / NRRL Y-10934 / UCD 77-7) TaxID=1071380 RepID=I2H4R2_HENB6|nr:hypothetical protein TBLA_0E03100 [Tetrapisispora blattae CBS 6284]CCH61364.1 hypothetical protein TBLA_0E03100 [Tetrapisispora blattae CBS 6284]